MTLSREEKIEILQLSEEVEKRKKYSAFRYFQPYEKQKEFMFAPFAQRCMGAGNQLGKTLCGSMEVAYHSTGQYPDWWKGARFKKANIGWVCGASGAVIRDSTQKLLIGRIQSGEEEIGTGTIPRDCIEGMSRARGQVDLMDHVKVKHVSGDLSIIFFKSYESGREKFQAETLDWVWFDEEPSMQIYDEGKTRTNNGQLGQFTMLTFTPLLGMTNLANQFYEKPGPNQHLTMMTIDDVDHHSEEEKRQIEADYPEYAREARARGVPMLGSGRVFQFTEAEISEDHIAYPPSHWFYINGLDFGWEHPQACIQIGWDKDDDVIHVLRGRAAKQTKPLDMFGACKSWAGDVRTAWPHDGFKHDNSGAELAQLYRDAGFKMLHVHAVHAKGGFGVETGLLEMQERFKEGRLKVDRSLDCFWREYRMYHRKDGKLVKVNDDVICAVRYAIMMKRFAEHKENNVIRPMRFATGMP